jgi:hypothetical protein
MTLQSLLLDDDDRVRALATTGALRVLGVQWTALPVSFMRTTLDTICTRLSCDSVPSVRLAVMVVATDLFALSILSCSGWRSHAREYSRRGRYAVD